MQTKYQKSKTRTIKRSEIKLADYNPRSIDDYAKKRLRDKMKDPAFGLINNLIWNEKTGNLVGGHQRLTVLDELEGNQDYELTVDVVSMSPSREKEANVFLNNTDAQGKYDLEKLAVLFNEGDITAEAAGWSTIELGTLFEGTDFLAVEEPETQIEESAEKILEMKAANGTTSNGDAIRDPVKHEAVIAEREQAREKMEALNEADTEEFYATVVFPSFDARAKFNAHFGADVEKKFVDGNMVLFKLGLGDT